MVFCFDTLKNKMEDSYFFLRSFPLFVLVLFVCLFDLILYAPSVKQGRVFLG